MKWRVYLLLLLLIGIVPLSADYNHEIPPHAQELIINELAQQSHEGFPAGTLIKTPSGYKPIESISTGSIITSYDHATKRQVSSTVVDIRTARLDWGVTVAAHQKVIIQAGPKTLFYDLVQQRWIQLTGHDISDDQRELFFIQNYDVDAVQITPTSHPSPQVYYLLLVDNHHNFFITEQDILVHNF